MGNQNFQGGHNQPNKEQNKTPGQNPGQKDQNKWQQNKQGQQVTGNKDKMKNPTGGFNPQH